MILVVGIYIYVGKPFAIAGGCLISKCLISYLIFPPLNIKIKTRGIIKMDCKSCNQDSFHVSNCRVSTCGNKKCQIRIKVPCEEMGMNGMMPPNGNGGAKECAIYLASDESIADDQFLGLGTASAIFIRHTVVIPKNAIITGLVFNIRDNTLTAGGVATAEIVISRSCGFGEPISTGVIASVAGPNSEASPNCCGTTLANYPMNECDLLSVQVSTGNGAFPRVAAATVLYTIST